MATTYKTTEMTNVGNFVLNSSYVKGVVKCFSGVYTTTGAETTGDFLSIASLPEGAMVLGISRVDHGALGSGLTLAAGDGDDDDRYKTATSAASAGTFDFDTIGGRGYVVGTADDDEAIALKFGGGTAAASIKIYTHVFYVV